MRQCCCREKETTEPYPKALGARVRPAAASVNPVSNGHHVIVLTTGTVHWSVPFIGRYRSLVGTVHWSVPSIGRQQSQKRPLADAWLDCAGTNRNDEAVSISARLPFGFWPKKNGPKSSRVREWASQKQRPNRRARKGCTPHQAPGRRVGKSKAVCRGTCGRGDHRKEWAPVPRPARRPTTPTNRPPA